MSIVVLGSINMDLVARTARLPNPGETLTGQTFHTYPGGKGANQAVACARIGAKTFMIGRVGSDVFGSTLKDGLATAGVNHHNVQIDRDVSSGVALIAVEDSAENIIIVIPGANGQVGEQELHKLGKVLDQAQVLLLQLEIPLKTVLAAAELANAKAVQVILDPAPVQTLPNEIYPLLDFITPNETETEILVGFPIDTKDDAARAAQILRKRGVRNVIIKMGGRGAYALLNDKAAFFKPFQVTAVDTVAAGDAFNGALAVGINEELPIEEAVRWAMAGGAMSVTKEGAQTSMSERIEILKLIETQTP